MSAENNAPLIKSVQAFSTGKGRSEERRVGKEC